MKRSDSPDYFRALSSGFSQPKDERNPKRGYSNEFQAMLDRLEEEEEEECIEESNLTAAEKKRRLSSHQVQALEKNFEVENKLEPQRKATLAQELGLQPRQVAVWFQNRRARWKTKQLERNYAVLKADYDSLRVDFDALERQKEALDAEIKELKGKLPGESTESDCSVQKQSPLLSETETNDALERSRICEHEFTGLNIEHCNETKVLGFNRMEDGPSESDSSGRLKEECKTSNAQLLISPAASSSSSSSQMVPHWPMMDCRAISENGFQAQFVGMEEQGFYGTTEESCNFFSVDQAPTLLWYYSNQ